jgi:hypothetical protein
VRSFLSRGAVYAFLARRNRKRSTVAAIAKSDRWVLLEIERNDNTESGVSWDVREVRKAA